MPIQYVDDQELLKIDYTKEDIKGYQFEDCHFSQCNFSGSDLSNCIFINCDFSDCDFTSSKINQTAFQTVCFKNCKLLGMDFSHINPFLFTLSAEDCQMNLCNFSELKMEKSVFHNCQILEAYFWNTNLSETQFSECNLEGSLFENTNLSKADMSTAWNFNINPDTNNIKGALFSKNNLIGLLSKYHIKVSE